MIGDPLLDAIVAAPDDDAPRLVWADREGGERGELVVIQCALTKEDLDAATRKRLTERAERIVTNLDIWGPGLFIQPKFVRGFIEELSLPLADLLKHLPQLLAGAPIVQTLVLGDCAAGIGARATPDDTWRSVDAKLRWLFDRWPAGRLRSLTIGAHVDVPGADWKAAKMTRYDFGDAFVELVGSHPSLQELRALSLPSSTLTRSSLVHLRKLPHLEALDARSGGDLLLSEILSLRESTR